MLGAAVLVEAARPKALREGVIHHDIRRDVPGQVAAALGAGLGVAQIVRVQVVAVTGMAAGGRRTRLEAVETGEDATGRKVLEQEMARAERQRQHLRNQVVVERDEESRLSGLAHSVLVEGAVGALYTGILDGRPGEGADVRQAAGIAGGSRRGVRG